MSNVKCQNFQNVFKCHKTLKTFKKNFMYVISKKEEIHNLLIIMRKKYNLCSDSISVN